MKSFTGPKIGLHSKIHNSVFIDTTHGLIYFPHSTMHVGSTASETSAKPQVVLIRDTITMPHMKTKTNTAFVDHPSEWKNGTQQVP